jgi:hypothetical protein
MEEVFVRGVNLYCKSFKNSNSWGFLKMQNLFELVQTEGKIRLKNGMILDTQVELGLHGQFGIYDFQQAVVSRGAVNSVDFHADEPRILEGFNEEPGYPFRTREIWERSGTMYGGGWLRDYDKMQTSNLGRFLLSRELHVPFSHGCQFLEVDPTVCLMGGSDAWYFEEGEYGELSVQLNTLLQNLGVPFDDVPGIIGTIYPKMGYPVGEIVEPVPIEVQRDKSANVTALLFVADADKRDNYRYRFGRGHWDESTGQWVDYC